MVAIILEPYACAKLVAVVMRPACSRTRNFLWLLAVLAGMCIRSDLLGVSSVVRSLGLVKASYASLLNFFHSRAIDADRLAEVWSALVLQIFPDIIRFNGRLVLLGDGIKIPKAGRKMPAVKRLHQESDNNNKPEYIGAAIRMGPTARRCRCWLAALAACSPYRWPRSSTRGWSSPTATAARYMTRCSR